MKVNLSRRAVADLRWHFKAGSRKFGVKTANTTFSRIDEIIHVALAANPRLGRYFRRTSLYRYVVSRTPFIIYYRFDETAKVVTIVSIKHGAQNRAEFEPD